MEAVEKGEVGGGRVVFGEGGDVRSDGVWLPRLGCGMGGVFDGLVGEDPRVHCSEHVNESGGGF